MICTVEKNTAGNEDREYGGKERYGGGGVRRWIDAALSRVVGEDLTETVTCPRNIVNNGETQFKT